MSHGNPSDEVAEDFLNALGSLTLNSRYEISNLTVIAKENTEHALAISEAVKNHIKQTSPQKKLPAFYVLDSIVKNVGTPYTLFFGRQLYSTFMEAYALVDNSVRRKMDEMLKTWKEPVPGSIDTRPVFPPEVTRPIENALIKARTSAVQAHQEHLRSQQQFLGRGRPIASPGPYRDTPTPPGVSRPPMHGPPGYPPNYGQQQQYPPPQQYPGQMPGQQHYPCPPSSQQYPPPQQYSTPQPSQQQYPPPQHNQQQYPPQSGQQQYPPPQSYPNQMNGQQPYGLPPRPPTQQYSQQSQSWQQPPQQGYGAFESTVDTLNSDIASLITASKADFAQNPWDSSIQTRLKALLDLQTILSSQQLPPDQIALIKDQVAQLSKSAPPPRIQTPPAPIAPPTPVAAPPPPAQQPTLSSLLGPGALAALLARQSTTPQPAIPAQPVSPVVSPPRAAPAPYNPPPTSSSTPVPDAASLLERLRAAGMLPGTPASTSTPPMPLGSLAGHAPPGFPPPPPFINTPPTASRTPLAEIPNDVVLKPTSLKIPRPHLISSLYERLGAPCTQCGRRFQSDEEGRKKKTAHMDWHFRVHQRMTEAEKRGQHRSWYVDELDWIKSREIEEDQNPNPSDSAHGPNATNASEANKPKLQYLAVPDDPALANSVCPICQEKFEMKWLDDAQEFVWMDARKVGYRIYHASCYAEATKDGGRDGAKRGTPEPSVLGKRKAEDEHIALRAKIKSEPES